jgi:small subunit ribosomal protein S16
MRRDGAALEYLGYYDPLETTGQRVKLNKERLEHWLSKGAAPSETVASFLRQEGITYKNPDRTRARNKVRTRKRQASKKAAKKTTKG